MVSMRPTEIDVKSKRVGDIMRHIVFHPRASSDASVKARMQRIKDVGFLTENQVKIAAIVAHEGLDTELLQQAYEACERIAIQDGLFIMNQFNHHLMEDE